MGMFSQNRTYLGSNIDVVANESYVGTAGAYRAMCEGYQNSYSIFESCIGLDFMEAAVVNEGVDEYEFAVVQESFVGDFFNKVKEFLLKLLEKIKGIIKSFITKVVGTFTSDGKELVKKYKDDILKKDLTKMKYKYAEPISGHDINIAAGERKYEELLEEIFHAVGHIRPDADASRGELDSDRNYTRGRLTSAKNYANSTSRATNLARPRSFSGLDERTLERLNDNINDNTYLEQAFGAAIGTSSVEMSEFAKEAKEYCFDTETTETDGADRKVTDIMLVLQQAKDERTSLEKAERASTKNIQEMIREIERANKEVMKLIPGNSTGDQQQDENRRTNATEINKILNTAQKAEQQLSTYVTKAYAVKLELVKFHFAQCKRIWVQMAAYRPKSVKEDAILIEAIGEAAEYEAYSSFTEAEMSY